MNWLVDADVSEPLILPQVQVASSTNDTQSVINVQGQAYRVHTWTTSGDITFSTGGDIEVLCVGGGGRGGLALVTSGLTTNVYGAGGGGGGGGVLQAKIAITANKYDATVGVGGASGVLPSDSSFGLSGSSPPDVVAVAGGSGGFTSSGGSVFDGANGGSSGGGAFTTSFDSDAGDRTFGQGNIGADGVAGTSGNAGGGGGAGTQGTGGSGFSPNGGNGVLSLITGNPVYYGGGGAGGPKVRQTTASLPIFETAIEGKGGIGGGGDAGKNAQNGTGGGGGGNFFAYAPLFPANVVFSTPGSGGSGIVIIRYPIEG